MRKPLAIEQFTVGSWLSIVWIPWGVLLFLFGGWVPFPEALLAMTVGFWLPAAAFALLPVNPYQFWMDRPNPSRRIRTSELDERQLRLLAAYYDPASRRRAVRYVLLASLGFGVLWLISLWIDRRTSAVWRIDYLLLGFFAIAIPTAGWIGFAGAGDKARRNWPEIIEKGPAWPADIRYPGSWKERITSFLSGQMPGFIR